MVGKTSEKAIKAWLALRPEERDSISSPKVKTPFIKLFKGNVADVDGDYELIASFTIASIVAKRYPRRKKVKK